MKKRILFPKNKQRKFLEDSLSTLDFNWPKFAKKLNLNVATLSKTYRFEKSRLPYSICLKICELVRQNSKIIFEKYGGNISKRIIVNPRKVIGENRKKLRDINIAFTRKNCHLDIENIELSRFDKKKNIILPAKITPLLAEEIGMHLGDGYLSDSKYEFRLKGNKSDEKEYYVNFVKSAYKKLFNLDLNLKEYESTYGFELSSKAIHQFKTKVLKLFSGRKDNIRFPDKLKINDVSIITAFLRGIFDTDGNVYFQSRYGYKNYYPCISLAQKSTNLIKDIYSLLKMLGFNPCLYENSEYHSISLYGYRSLRRFLELIGFNNPKHLCKIENWKKTYPKLVAIV